MTAEVRAWAKGFTTEMAFIEFLCGANPLMLFEGYIVTGGISTLITKGSLV